MLVFSYILAQWLIQISESNIGSITLRTVNSQAMFDFLAQFLEEDILHIKEEVSTEFAKVVCIKASCCM